MERTTLLATRSVACNTDQYAGQYTPCVRTVTSVTVVRFGQRCTRVARTHKRLRQLLKEAPNLFADYEIVQQPDGTETVTSQYTGV
jgi:hypothetical protein